MRLRLRAPGSTSNLGSGFDCLGMALDLGLSLEVETAAPGALTLQVRGSETEGVPLDAGNASAKALLVTLRQAGHPVPGLHLRVDNDIPVGRGLGSSAAAIVAGVAAAHLLMHGEGVDKDDIVRDAAAIEGHPDNVAPAVFGGVVAACRDSERLMTLPFPLPASLQLGLVIPAVRVSTADARKLLTRQVSRDDAVFNLQRLAMLLGGFVHDDPAAWRAGTQDRLHQEQRLSLYPGLDAALQSLLDEPECLAAFLSGSGPTLIGFYRRLPASAGTAATAILARHGIPARRQAARPTTCGLVWECEQSS